MHAAPRSPKRSRGRWVVVNRIIFTKDCNNEKRMDLAVSRDVRGRWQRIYWPSYKVNKLVWSM